MSIANHKLIRGELDQLLREGLLDSATYQQLSTAYPLTPWDWHTLGRWFLIFGSISTAAGCLIALHDMVDFTLPKLAIGLAVLMVELLLGGQMLRQRQYHLTGLSVELLAGFTLISLSFTLGMIFSTGSGNWPALLLIDLIVLLGASYTRNNILLLSLCAVLFFVWFGGATGYDSQWGGYWFGMNYPLRFLGASLVIIGLSEVHKRGENQRLAHWRGFAKVWLSSGLFLAEMALWLLSLFGNFGTINDTWHELGMNELLLFNALWAAANLVLLLTGARSHIRMLVGYAITFLIIQGYTLFFAHLASKLGLSLSFILAGGSALALTVFLEKKRRAAFV